jgi:hypothetical protein
MWDILRTLYEVIGAPNPRVSVVVMAILGAILSGGGWWLLGKHYEKTQRGAVAATGEGIKPASPSKAGADETKAVIRDEAPTKEISSQTEVIRARLAAMYGSAKRLTLSIDRDQALMSVIDTGTAAGRPDLVADYVRELRLGIDRDRKYKEILDAMIQLGQLEHAQSVVDKLSLSIDRDAYHQKIVDAWRRR